MDDILICKCGWLGKVEKQDALGSECGCCPDCGDEDLKWLSDLRERIKVLETLLEQLIFIAEKSTTDENEKTTIELAVQALEGK